MERIRLTDPADPRFGDAFALYEISFPVYERRTRAAQAARLSHPEYHFDLLMEGERFLGIIAVADVIKEDSGALRYLSPASGAGRGNPGAGPAERRGGPRGAGDRPAPGRGLHPAAAFL